MARNFLGFIIRELMILAGFVAALYGTIFLVSLILETTSTTISLDQATSLEIYISFGFLILYVLYLIARFTLWILRRR